MSTDRQSIRAGAAKISASVAQQIDSSFAAVANPEVIAVGMMRDLGATDLGAGEGRTRTVGNKPIEDSPELVAARKSGSLERVLRAKRQQASTREGKATSPGEPRRPLKAIYDFSQIDDDELSAIDPATLTPTSSDAYVQEIDQRMAGSGSYAEAQAWQIEEGEDVQTFDIDDAESFDDIFERAAWEAEQS